MKTESPIMQVVVKKKFDANEDGRTKRYFPGDLITFQKTIDFALDNHFARKVAEPVSNKATAPDETKAAKAKATKEAKALAAKGNS